MSIRRESPGIYIARVNLYRVIKQYTVRTELLAKGGGSSPKSPRSGYATVVGYEPSTNGPNQHFFSKLDVSINTSKSEPFRNNSQLVKKKRCFFRYVRDTLTWRRVRGRGNVVLQQDIRLCKCLKNLVLYTNKRSLPPKFQQFQCKK